MEPVKELNEKSEKHRPPWRNVAAISTAKSDKTALLRARLLDASRRMRAGKIQVATQTDIIPTKLMKEVNIDVQCDLINKEDKEILTDGTISLKHEGNGEFFLTHSVAQMTDEKKTVDSQTQTLTPKISHSAFEKAMCNVGQTINRDRLNESLIITEKRLQNQIDALNVIDNQLRCPMQQSFQRYHNNLLKIPDYATAAFFRNEIAPAKTLKKSTIAAWDFSLLEDNAIYENTKLVVSFGNKSIEDKLANMKLSPVPFNKLLAAKRKSSSSSHISRDLVNTLIEEARALLEVFDQISMMFGPDINLNDLPQISTPDIRFLSEYWNPILKDCRDALKSKLNNCKVRELQKAHPLNPEILDSVVGGP